MRLPPGGFYRVRDICTVQVRRAQEMARIGIAEELSRAEACPPFVGSSFFFLEKMAFPTLGGYTFAVYGVTTL